MRSSGGSPRSGGSANWGTQLMTSQPRLPIWAVRSGGADGAAAIFNSTALGAGRRPAVPAGALTRGPRGDPALSTVQPIGADPSLARSRVRVAEGPSRVTRSALAGDLARLHTGGAGRMARSCTSRA